MQGRWFRGSGQIFHFLYGENLYRYLGTMKKFVLRQNAVVATYHTPAWRMRELVTDLAHLQQLDAMVVMAESQREYLQTLAPGVPVHFIPHGVDTGYFRPLVGDHHSNSEPIKLLCVGAHLRDFAVFAPVARNLLTIDPDIEFHLVCNTKDAAGVPDLPNIKKWSANAKQNIQTWCGDRSKRPPSRQPSPSVRPSDTAAQDCAPQAPGQF